MKKFLAIVLAVAVVLGLSVTAFAAGPEKEAGNASQQSTENSQQGPTVDVNSQVPEINGEALSGTPVFIDFDALAAEGVISQETLEKIKSYMEENKPEGLPEMNGEVPSADGQMPSGEKPEGLPEMNGEVPEMDGAAPGGLLADLLEDGVITQSEYDAIIAAVSE